MHMNTRMARAFQRSPGAANIGFAGTGQPGNHGPGNFSSHQVEGAEIIFRSHRESSLDDICTESIQLVRHAQLVIDAHAATGRLLSVTQRCVKESNAVSFHRSFASRVWQRSIFGGWSRISQIYNCSDTISISYSIRQHKDSAAFMDLFQLEPFLLVAYTGSFSASAGHVHRTLPA